MPSDAQDIKKYHTIGEVAQLFSVSTSLIRFWEKRFPSLQPHKNKQGVRQYTQANIKQIRRIYQLVKEQGYTLQGAQSVLKHQRNEPKNNLEIIRALRNVRSFLVLLKENEQ